MTLDAKLKNGVLTVSDVAAVSPGNQIYIDFANDRTITDNGSIPVRVPIESDGRAPSTVDVRGLSGVGAIITTRFDGIDEALGGRLSV